MLTLSLYPAQFAALIAFLSRISRDNLDLPLKQQSLTACVLLAFQATLRLEQVFTWGQRNARRSYKYRLPVTVARALHQEMPYHPLTPDQQALLRHLDQTISTYRPQLLQRYARNPTGAYA